MKLDLKKFLGYAGEEIETKEVDEKIVKANAYLAHAKALFINTDDQRDEAKKVNTVVYERLKVVKKELKADIDAAEVPVKRLKLKMKEFVSPTDAATILVANKILQYDEFKRKKKEDEDRIKREEAEKERARLQKIADDEAKKKADEDREAALEKAQSLEALGQSDAAAQVLDHAAEIVPEVVHVAAVVEVDPMEALDKLREQDKQVGQKDWEITVTNIHAVPDEYVKKEIKLRDLKKKISDTDGKVAIPGVTWVEVKKAKRG